MRDMLKLCDEYQEMLEFVGLDYAKVANTI